MSSENLLRLITVFDVSEEAEALINTLRNAGFIVRDVRVEDDEDLTSAIEENPVDIVISKFSLPLINAKQVHDILLKSGRDLPLIVVIPKYDPKAVLECFKFGARDILPFDQVEQLKFIMQREMADLQERRTQRRCENMLHETEKRARALIDTSRDAITYVHDGMHIYANNAYLMMFGYEELDDIEGMPILDMVSKEDHSKLKDFLRSYAKGQAEDDKLEVKGQHALENKFDMVMEFSPASMEGESCTQIIIRDTADSKELAEKIDVLSKQDLLTGLYNRSHLMQQLDKLIAVALDGKGKGALLYISLDHYDDLKESHGIAGLDMLIVDIANTLRDKLERVGMFARFDGPVFCLLIHNADLAQAEKIGEGICLLIADHISDINGKTIRSTASVGIALINETTSNLHDVLTRAEKGATIAQEDNGSKAVMFNPGIEELEEREKKSHWEKQLKYSLKNNQLRLLFQPIVSLHGEPGAHYEVFVRLLNDAGEEITPDEFIPAAEKVGLMQYIDRWVITNSFVILADRLRNKEDVRIFLKLSSASLVDEDFLKWVTEKIKTLRLNADHIVFQVNEETALNFLKPTKAIFAGLQQLHCRTALSGFGIEENLFQSLKHFDINYIKIHHDLITKLAANIEHQERVKNIAEEVSMKNIQTIAAFVEDANSLAVLWQCSVNYIQGYFLQEPIVKMEYNFEESF